MLDQYSAPPCTFCISEQTAWPNNVLVELSRLDVVPAETVERYAAQTALVRYQNVGDDAEHTVCASENWARLFIALIRVHPPSGRITHALLSGGRRRPRPPLLSNEVLHRGDGDL